ncbi:MULTISPECIES: chaperone NapD [Franconibacter]|uniref:Chaperone NapD n=1 Tax=Franconibacter daqui TaxID=2047724 RepID=A0ABV1PLS6_9ENTR|nr:MULTISPECIES: chaperone NapD [Franconibacter]MCK1970021.1 chaperone NapD [Franconibacter sp. IITDAS19]MEB5923089.1 chaperone NapD [Franconibacter daqui]
MTAEWHVCGLLVQARPDDIAAAAKSISARPGCEVAAQDEAAGKLVVVMEAATSAALLANIESARQLEGVLAVSLVYHQQEACEEHHETQSS